MIYEISDENLNRFFERIKGYIDEKVECLTTALIEQGTLPADWNQSAEMPEVSEPEPEPAFDSKSFADSLLTANPS